jgi:NADH-quinone oxidoreductase subunit L
MAELLWLIPALPFAGFAVLALAGRRLPGSLPGAVGAGSVGLSALVATLVAAGFFPSPPEGGSFTQVLWSWVNVGGFSPGVSLYLDGLSLTMVLVITWVAFFIHLYSVEFMRRDEGYSRFFAYMNLFVGSMLTLVLAENLLLLYLGWEGVGLCSYLLIGFWYRDPANGHAARKAFIVTRVGDAAMAVGLFLLFNSLGTLGIQELMGRAEAQWAPGSALAVAAAALLLAGALGKSAQLPLQVWLPDAMAGPTPVSALIHAATMVTAGVYLIARTHVIFTLAPPVQHLVALIGAATLLVSGMSALTQRDIKRVLAYSTISQIGYMFLALGVGAFSAAIFHFMTHAFFKALLFLSAGVVIQAMGEEHDIFKMGGLRKELPFTFWAFLIGASSLSALPLVTAGFYSKDFILENAWSSIKGGPWLWAAGAAGALLTSLYAFRVVFFAFFGSPSKAVERRPGLLIKVPLGVLALLSLAGGFIGVPRWLSATTHVLPAAETAAMTLTGTMALKLATSLISVGGVYLAYLFFLRRPPYMEALARSAGGRAVERFWFSGWGFDWIYGTLLVRPFLWVSRINREDFVDLFFGGIAWYNGLLYGVLTRSQSGKMRWYAVGIALGAVIVMGIVAVL